MENSKQLLLEQCQESFDRLLQIIARIPPRKRALSIETIERDKNLRDILMHLYEWHAMLKGGTLKG